jgi:hypothetical protein
MCADALQSATKAWAAGRSTAAACRKRAFGTCSEAVRYGAKRRVAVEDKKLDENCPPPVLSADPEQELEKKLRKNPDDLDTKVDVGSDESMDASDPPSSSQPGQKDEPVPSSGFPG